MQLATRSRWIAVGVCVALVAALRWGDAPEAVRDVDATAQAPRAIQTVAAQVSRNVPVSLGTMPTMLDPAPIGFDAATLRALHRNDTLHIALPDGTTYPVRIDQAFVDPFGQRSLIGEVATRSGPQSMVLTHGDAAVFGTLPMPDGRALQVVTNHGAVVATIAGGLIPEGQNAIAGDAVTGPFKRGDRSFPMFGRFASVVRSHVDDDASMPTAAASATASASATQRARTMSTAQALRPAAATATPTTITVLAVYADDLVKLRGTDAAVQTELSNQVVAANQAHVDSGSAVRLKLVAKKKMNIPSHWGNYDALLTMTAMAIDGVDTEALRNDFSADLVTLVRPFANYENCGIAWVGGAMRHGLETDSLFGYSVVNREPCGPHVMAHEIGHNLGAAHDRATESEDGTQELQLGAFNYSFGWKGADDSFATIMAYATGKQPWLGKFSTPLLKTCNNQPCGIVDYADNVRAFGRMAKTISEFRGTKGTGSISDAEVVATHNIPGVKLRFPVRLSVAPGASGAAVTVSITAGSQWIQNPGPVTVQFAPFQQNAFAEWDVSYTAMTNVDITRVVTATMSAPYGFTLADATASGQIYNPRLMKVNVNESFDGVTPWDEQHHPGEYGIGDLEWEVEGADGPRDSWFHVQYTFFPLTISFESPKGSILLVNAYTYGREWRAIPAYIEEIDRDTNLLLKMVPTTTFSGKVMVPDGTYPLPSGFYENRIEYSETYDGVVIHDKLLQPSGFNERPIPGSTLQVIVNLHKDYGGVPSVWRFTDVRGPISIEMIPSGKPSAAIFSTPRMREGREGERRVVAVALQLTGPAPAGGATVKWATSDGTAKAGKDYVAAGGQVTFKEGESFKVASVTVLGDRVLEHSEYFDVAMTQATGVPLGGAAKTRVVIVNDDATTGGPGQKQLAQ